MGVDKPLIVVSGIALRSGGPLTIIKDVLNYLETNELHTYRVKALVHSKDVFTPKHQDLEIITVEGGESYLKRLKLEYITFHKWSKQWQPYLWLSLHDISPRVIAKRQAVYCHNPSPFYQASIKSAFYSPAVTLFSFFYKYLYRFNIKSNDFVIVQQQWLRKAFEKMFPIQGKTVVAYAGGPSDSISKRVRCQSNTSQFNFFYPAFPRIFKNHEVLLKAFESLSKSGLASSAQLIVTIDGSENKYSAELVKRFKHLSNVDFIGLRPHDEIMGLMKSADALLFPSKLETWGLPISEAKAVGLPMIVADLPYAHETVSDYDAIRFFNPDDHEELAGLINDFCSGEEIFEDHTFLEPAQPFTESWKQLFTYLLETTK